MFPSEEAEHCRSLAFAFEGKAEASFLLKVAEAFEELAAHGSRWRAAKNGQSRQIVGGRHSPVLTSRLTNGLMRAKTEGKSAGDCQDSGG